MAYSRSFYLFSLLLCFTAARGELSGGENFGLAVSVDTVFSSGLVNELIYPSVESKNAYLSTLEWEIRNVFFIGPTVTIDFLEKFSFSFSAYGNLNAGSGRMRNSDWKVPESADTSHFSESHVVLDSFTNWHLNAALHRRFAAFRNIAFYGGLGFRFYQWTFQDTLISYRYPPELQGTLDKYIGGNTVSYSVNYFLPQVLLAGAFEYEWFRALIDLRYGFLGYIDAVDNHVIRRIRFRDRIFPAHYLGAGLFLWFRVQKFTRIRIDLNFAAVLETRGYTIIEKPQTLRHRVQPNQSGNSGIWFDAGIGIEFQIF